MGSSIIDRVPVTVARDHFVLVAKVRGEACMPGVVADVLESVQHVVLSDVNDLGWGGFGSGAGLAMSASVAGSAVRPV
jgi:hypothetical protein